MKNGPRSGSWPFPGPGTSTVTAGAVPSKLSFDDIKGTIEKIRGLPAARWMLISPEGHIYADEDPMKLAAILAQRKLGLGGFDIRLGDTP